MGDDRERLLVLAKVMGFFKNDLRKAARWYETENPLLGGISPEQMVRVGRLEKLIKWIEQQLKENEAPSRDSVLVTLSRAFPDLIFRWPQDCAPHEGMELEVEVIGISNPKLYKTFLKDVQRFRPEIEPILGGRAVFIFRNVSC